MFKCLFITVSLLFLSEKVLINRVPLRILFLIPCTSMSKLRKPFVQAARRVGSARARCITVRSMVWIVTIREEEEVLVSEML